MYNLYAEFHKVIFVRGTMSYTSFSFLAFILIGGIIYFLLPKKLQPFWLLVLNTLFYIKSDIRFAAFLAFSLCNTYIAGRLMSNAKPEFKKIVAAVTLLLNLGILIFVKWGGYFLSRMAAPGFGNISLTGILVPLGISFYTLQAVSYCVDVYRGKYPAEKNFIKYSLFMSFFPVIVQGPISRFDQLADQVYAGHSFEYRRVKFGAQLMLWGFFKKLVIADRAAMLVNQVFDNYAQYKGLEIFIAAVFYSIQLYADFSGCVDICRGVSQIFGIELARNFNHPYFSDSIKDFWRRWHISLSSWLKDYVYIPLGGNRKGVVRKYLNILIVFFVSGMWHGVGIHYLAWGLLHGAYQVIGGLTEPMKNSACLRLRIKQNTFPYRLWKKAATFFMVTFAWIFFRAPGLKDALKIIKAMFSPFNPWIISDGTLFKLGLDAKDFSVLVVSVAVLLCVSIAQTKWHLREKLSEQSLWFRWGICYAAIFAILIFGIYGPGYSTQQFIYMKF